MEEPSDKRQYMCFVGPVPTPFHATNKHQWPRPPYTRTIYNFPQHPGGPLMQAAWFFEGKSTTDCDGSPRAYKFDSKAAHEPLERTLTNAHDHDNWFGVVTMLDGKPRIDGKGKPYVQTRERRDPYPGFLVSKTSLQNTQVDDYRDPSRYCDPETIPFTVLPGKGVHKDGSIYTGDGLIHEFNGTQIGDLAYVICADTQRSYGAVIADGGPANKAGESSVRLLEQLGFPGQDGNNSPESVMQFVLFPRSASRLGGWPAPEPRINEAAKALFVEWGGLARLQSAFPYNPRLKTLRLMTPGL